MTKKKATYPTPGRPKRWSTPQELRDDINQYLGVCIQDKQRPSKAGLCAALDVSRDTLSEYDSKGGEYSDAIKSAYRQIEASWVARLNDQGATGAIFYLKNAFGGEYRDKVETDITTKGERLEGGADIVAIAAEAARILKEQKLND